MNVFTILLMFFVTSTFSLRGMEGSITYKEASLDDLKGLLKSINQEAIKDSNNIVVLPEKFREEATKKAVEKGLMFVAVKQRDIIAFKKLFVPDDNECNEILQDELRIVSDQDPQLSTKIVLNDSPCRENILPSAINTILKSSITYIYTGGDFTNNNYRGQGINNDLTESALSMIKSRVIDDIKRKKSTYLAIMYGLTLANAGNASDIMDGRTKSIFKQFYPFAQTVAKECDILSPNEFFISRYNAFKPSFDPYDTECKPLPDKESIPGYGYIIVCPLVKHCN